jgi:5'(3')-deoxyribonucleotidase
MKIFLDLDGVLVDWSGGLCKLMNIDPMCDEAQRILKMDKAISGWKFGSVENVERKVNEAGYDFWYNLELTPWAYNLLHLCEQYSPVYFLTSPGPFHAAGHAKLDYIEKHFRSTNTIITKHKEICAGPRYVLIDDLKRNITEWEHHGGIPFHWPCQWELRKNPDLLESTLSNLEQLLKTTTQIPMEFSS